LFAICTQAIRIKGDNVTLKPSQQEDLLKRGFSRRHFGKLAGFLAAGSTLPFYNEAALAQLSQVRGAPADAVMINANENPLGPCAEAADAMRDLIAKGGRYNYGVADDFAATLAEQEGLKESYVQAFAGSSAPLHQAVLAFTSPARPYVMGDPGYESGANAAKVVGAPVIKVPLTKTYAHDVRAMAAASPNAGLIYIANPNNPSGTLTPKEDIAWLVKNKPAGSILMIDEAYIHIAGAPFSTEYVARDEDVIILRTFSKIYGMAGLRAGAAIAKPELLARITQWSSGALPVTGMVGANISLKVKNLVPERRKIIGDVREDVLAFMEKHNFKYVPSVSNKFMADTGRPYDEIITALRAEKVYIGRGWPVWPTHVRVSIGTPEEMAKFKTAFLKIMSA
jgi:histidinol-phosphate aminotransferase